MKFFLAFILSFIVLTETVVPCCLWDDCHQEETTTKSPEQKKDKSGCSPFASCSTCSPRVLNATVSVQEISETAVAPQHGRLAVPFLLFAYSPSLLQPPRLA